VNVGSRKSRFARDLRTSGFDVVSAVDAVDDVDDVDDVD
jgi:hypothetical protein